ncbi:cytochrome c1-like [Phoenix dactylifera]|uniref:Cytochrome c1-like n=1 Tax=Phoenix dactylifera TaxID=42345 RepID=A0A8B8ZQ65_PHODC|nr:cytochrome c1-like [Phoenix dactylifera]
MGESSLATVGDRKGGLEPEGPVLAGHPSMGGYATVTTRGHIAKMVTKSEVLYARFQKRAAKLAGEPTEPKKKAKVSATTAAETGAPSNAHFEAGRREGPRSRDAISGGVAMALPCPAPILQIPGRQEAPGTDQGGRTSTADLGFKDFRNQLRRLLPDFDLNLLQPGARVEEPGAEAEAPASDGADQEGSAEAGEAAPEVAEAAPEAAPKVAPEAAEATEVEASVAEEPAVPEVVEDSRAEP